MLTLTNKKNSFLLFLGLIALAISIFGFIFTLNKVHYTNDEYNKLLDLEAERLSYESTRKQNAPIIKKAESYIPIISSYFASSSDPVAFVERLESIASTTGAKINLGNLNIEENKMGDVPVKFVKLSFDASGSWSSIMKTLYVLENMPVKTLVQNVSLRKVGDPDTKVTNWIFTTYISGVSI